MSTPTGDRRIVDPTPAPVVAQAQAQAQARTPVPTGRPQPRGWVPGSAAAALTRYRVVAYIVGVGLVVLVLIGVPLKYLGHDDAVVAVVGPIHGFLYIVYLVFSLDLALRWRWSPVRAVLVMLAGTVPFLSFVAERTVTRKIHADTRD